MQDKEKDQEKEKEKDKEKEEAEEKEESCAHIRVRAYTSPHGRMLLHLLLFLWGYFGNSTP